ncbi:hypothetical protein ACH5RR_038363 [Cinchona calisaya]|uniref:NIN-like protein n=1 Tax=Cinchona calisaya TaxID=153742 RepID=A0ABD2Y0I4_9GENT
MDLGGGCPDPHLQSDEEIDTGHYNGTCSIDEFLNYYTAKSKGAVSKPSWESGDNGLTIFWHQKEDESQSQLESEPATTAYVSDSLILANYMRRSQTHEPNKETLQHKIISVLSSLSLPKDDVFLIQLWAPTKIRGRMVLTTCGQPFAFSYIINSQEEEGPPEQPHYSFRKGICRYRKICLGLHYDVVDHFDNTTNNVGIDGSNSSSSQQQQQVLQLGPPGRVFKQGLPELSSYIGYFTNQEFPLGGYAENECGFLDYFALPLFESTGGHHCLGVLEILTNNFLLLQYAVAACFFGTLERAHLRLQPPHLHECSKIRKDVLSSRVDIKEVLKIVREVYQLPLVQTWFPCMCGEGDPEKYVGYHASFPDHAFKTTNLFCEMLNYDSNKEYFAMYMDCCHKYGGFSIREGKGLVGRAYSFKKAYFCIDASQFTLSDYPIVHCTRAAELTACFAIPLHFLDPLLYAFVLEIFLPPGQLQNYSSDAVLVALLKLLLSTMINAFSRLNGSLGLQQVEEFSVELVPSSDDDDDNLRFFDICRSGGNLNNHNEALENARAELQVQSSQPPPITEGSNVANNVRKKQHSSIAARSKRQDIAGTSRPEDYASARARITLDVLKRYSGVKLVDAAKSLGVSRSTLKRICKDLGIKDWRSLRRTKDEHHMHSSDPRLPAAGAVEIVEEDVIQESEGGNPGMINALVEKEAAAPMIPTSAINGKGIALGGEIGDKSAAMIVKATYKGKNVRFPLTCNSGIKHLRQKIAKRFELQVESFTIEYEDEEGDSIMIVCDEDLHDHIESLKSSGQNKIKLLVVPKIFGAE